MRLEVDGGVGHGGDREAGHIGLKQRVRGKINMVSVRG